MTSNNTSIYDHKQRLDVIEKDIKNIPLNSTEIVNIKIIYPILKILLKIIILILLKFLILKMILLISIQI